MLRGLLNLFRRPKWEDFEERNRAITANAIAAENLRRREVRAANQWRTNFSLTAAQRSERSRKAAATRKANKAAALSQEDRE